MNNIDILKSLAVSHGKLSRGIFTREVYVVGGVEISEGFSREDSSNSNLGAIVADSPAELNLGVALEKLHSLNKDSGIYVFPWNIEKGLMEVLVRYGMKFDEADTWMFYDFESDISNNAKHEVVEITKENFKDYYSVLSSAFRDFDGNEAYLELLKGLIGNKTNSKIEDLVSTLFLIYDNGKPAAGAALFWSKSENIAYMHDAGTLEEFRGKGYQTALINHRVKFAKEKNINRIYSMVEFGGQSWNNLIKQGFKQLGLAYKFL